MLSAESFKKKFLKIENENNTAFLQYCLNEIKKNRSEQFKERKGKCLSKKYIDVDTPLKWKCTRGHIWKAIPYSVIHRGSWCRKCSYIEKRSKYKYHQ